MWTAFTLGLTPVRNRELTDTSHLAVVIISNQDLPPDGMNVECAFIACVLCGEIVSITLQNKLPYSQASCTDAVEVVCFCT